MWIVLGLSSILFTILNLLGNFKKNNNVKYFRFIALSLTALTVTSFYANIAFLAIKEDFSAIIDIAPAVSKALWFCVIISILLNSISLFNKIDK